VGNFNPCDSTLRMDHAHVCSGPSVGCPWGSLTTDLQLQEAVSLSKVFHDRFRKWGTTGRWCGPTEPWGPGVCKPSPRCILQVPGPCWLCP
jgi:hypothetical protein